MNHSRFLQLRLAAWILLAGVLSVGQVVWLVRADLGRSFCPALLAGELLEASLVWLLLTAPEDAIRLRRPASEMLILAVTVGLQGCGGGKAAIEIGVISLCLVFLLAARRLEISPWWVVLMAWNPLLSAAGELAIRHAG